MDDKRLYVKHTAETYILESKLAGLLKPQYYF
mgnify:CR=1 FL=1